MNTLYHITHSIFNMFKKKDETYKIYFCNKTDLPVLVETWVKGSNILQRLKVNAQDIVLLESSVGEWHLNAMFSKDDEEAYDAWLQRGLLEYADIGKFRCNPCAQGNYSWLNNEDIFQCKYKPKKEEADGDIKGLMVFSLTTVVKRSRREEQLEKTL